MDIHSYHAKGKLLLSSEYLVLDGAQALCLPLNLGQSLSVSPSSSPTLQWLSYQNDGQCWFSGEFDHHFNILQSSDTQVADTLSGLLKICHHTNPDFSPIGIKVETTLEFDRQWGLGSSSTLISTLAQWAEVDPYRILDEGFGGSGYDVAAATAHRALLFQIEGRQRRVEEVHFSPPFANELYFVYSGVKQSSRQGIQYYRQLPLKRRLQSAHQSSILTQRLLSAQTLSEFEDLLQQHESLLSQLLGMESIKQEKFYDYTGGQVKSLGAWGGDFFLATGKQAPEYFQSKGYHIVLKFNDIVAK